MASSKVYITTPFPTKAEVIAHYGLSAARVAEIERWIEEHRAEQATRAERQARRRKTSKPAAARAKKK